MKKHTETKRPVAYSYKSGTQPAPNKAQPSKADAATHSPLPWSYVSEVPSWARKTTMVDCTRPIVEVQASDYIRGGTMSAKRLAKLRALPLAEVERRMNNAVEQGKHGAFWRYYFEIALRKMETRAAQ